jgi:glutaredoxin-like YruB-family protein
MVIIYSTPTCPFCETLKEYLKSKNIDFEAVDISSDDKKLEEMVEKLKKIGMGDHLGVPVIDINGEMVIGFDKGKIDELLKIS